MLQCDGPWLENAAKEVTFPDDDPYAFGLVLLIIHGQFHNLPGKIRVKIFVQLAILCDKYQMTNVVRKPFLENWMSPWTKFNGDDEGYYISCGYTDSPNPVKIDSQALLFVAWTFGFEAHFLKHLKQLILELENGEELKAELMPDGMEGKPLKTLPCPLRNLEMDRC
jgi:hypothetical protein